MVVFARLPIEEKIRIYRCIPIRYKIFLDEKPLKNQVTISLGSKNGKEMTYKDATARPGSFLF